MPANSPLSLSPSLDPVSVELSESVSRFRASEADRVPEKNLGLPGARSEPRVYRALSHAHTRLEIRLPVEKRGSARADEQRNAA